MTFVLTAARVAEAQQQPSSALCALSRSPYLPIASMPNDPCPYDQDGNGLDDEVELEIAKCLAPELRFDARENALVAGAEPALLFAIYRTGIDHVQILMSGLFQNDGGFGADGGFGCTDAHAGDTMPLAITAQISQGRNAWYARAISLYNGRDPSEISMSLDQSHPILFPSAGKHHQYSQPFDGVFIVTGGIECDDVARGNGVWVVPGQQPGDQHYIPQAISSPIAHVPARLGSYIGVTVESTPIVPDDSNVCILERTGDDVIFELAEPTLIQDFVNVCSLGRAGSQPGPSSIAEFVQPLSDAFQGSDLTSLGFPGQSLFAFHLEIDEVDHRPITEVQHTELLTADVDLDGQDEIFTFEPQVLTPNEFDQNACTLARLGQFVPAEALAPTDLCSIDTDQTDTDGDGLAGKCDPNPLFRNAYVAGGGLAPYLAYPGAPSRLAQEARTLSRPWSFNAPRGGFMDRDQDSLVEGEDLCPTVYAGLQTSLNPDTNYWGEQADFSTDPELPNLGELYRGDVCDPYPATTTLWKDHATLVSPPPLGCGQVVTPTGGADAYRVQATVSAYRSANDPAIQGNAGASTPTPLPSTYLGQAYRCACIKDDCLTDPTSECFARGVKRAEEATARGVGWLPMQRQGCSVNENGYCTAFTMPNLTTQTISWGWRDEAALLPDHFIVGDISTSLLPGPYLTQPAVHSMQRYAASVRVIEGDGFNAAPGAMLTAQNPFREPEQTTTGGALADIASTESRRLRASFEAPQQLTSPFGGMPQVGPNCRAVPLPPVCLACAVRFDPQWVQVSGGRDPLGLLKATATPWVYRQNAGSFATSTFLLPNQRAALTPAVADTLSWVGSVAGTGVAAGLSAAAESGSAVAPSILFVERAVTTARWALLDAVSVAAPSVTYATRLDGEVGGGVSETAKVLSDPRTGVAVIVDAENQTISGFDPELAQWVQVAPVVPALFARTAPAIALSGSSLFVIGGMDESPRSDGWVVDVLTGVVVPRDFGLPARAGAVLTPSTDLSSLLFIGGVDATGAVHDDVWSLPLTDPKSTVATPVLSDSTRALHFDPSTLLFGSASDASFAAWSVNSDGSIAVRQRDARGWHAPECPAADLKTYGLFARAQLDLDAAVRVLYASGFGTVASAGTSTTQIGSASELGSVISNADVTFESDAIVHGSVFTSETIVQPPETVEGTVEELAPLEMGDITCASPTAPVPGENVVVPSLNARVLSPGSYGTAFLGAHSDLSISSGTYFFTELTLDMGSTLHIDTNAGPVRIYVSSALEISGLIADESQRPDRILFVYSGTASVSIEQPFRGTLVAPNADLQVSSCEPDSHKGAFFAKNLNVTSGTTILAMPFTENWLP